MKKLTKKVLTTALVGCLTLGCMTTPVLAAENVWYGDSYSVEVTAGTDGYEFLSCYPAASYEMSNHGVLKTAADGSTHNEIPMLLMMLDAGSNYTWTPSGIYSFGNSNYEVMYCCDVETMYKNSVYYKRLNLEDSNYYDADAAAYIRAIVTNSYPYVSLEQMKANLAAEGFADADKLTRPEIISAVQMAIWSYANVADNYTYTYLSTFDVPSNPQWGKVLHDYTNEMDVWWTTGKGKLTKNETVGARIMALADHLKAQTAVYAEKNQIIISDIEIVDFVPVMGKDGYYKIAVRVALNNSGSSEQDSIQLTALVNGEPVASQEVALGTDVYTMLLEAKAGENIQVVVSGDQILPEGVYFYEPQGGREVSQCLVGIAQGETSVYAEEEVSLKVEEETIGCNLVLQKQDNQGNALAGAEFALYAVTENGNILIDTYQVDENGSLTIENLLPGTYALEETVAPEGYALPIQNILFSVTEDGETAVIEVEEVSGLVEYEDTVMEVINYEDDVLGDSEGPEDEVLGDNDSPNTGNGNGIWMVMMVLSAMTMIGMMTKKKVKE